MMRIMNAVGVSRWEALEGKLIRIAVKPKSGSTFIIGNIIEDKWFDLRAFFEFNEYDDSSIGCAIHNPY